MSKPTTRKRRSGRHLGELSGGAPDSDTIAPVAAPKLILASTSIYRRTLLERLRVAFEVIVPDTDETRQPGEAAACTALRLAEAKARAVAVAPPALIIGSDQVAELDGEHLGKPGDHPSAVTQLRAMRGREVIFHTALCLVNAVSGAAQTAIVPTAVRFRFVSDAQIERYLELERPYDCAGSARVEMLGIALADRIASDDPTALIGLPLITLVSMLRAEGVEVL